MAAGSLTGRAFQVHNQVAPVGRVLTGACLTLGYTALALSVFAPDALNAVLGTVSGGTVLLGAYLVTFVYPAAYTILALMAAFGAVDDRSDTLNWNRRDRIHVYLAVAFAEWTVHHFLYLLFPLMLLWGARSLVMGVAYAIPVWGMLCIAVVGIIVGNRYLWYHDPDSLPIGASRRE